MPAIWQHLSKAFSAALRTLAPVSTRERARMVRSPLSPSSTALVWVEPTSTPAAILIVFTSRADQSRSALPGVRGLQRLKKCVDAVLGLGFGKVARVFQVGLYI